jgi:hypothetical protein
MSEDMREMIDKIKNFKQFVNEQEDQIQSNINNNFWKWFGNSKVINRDGSPMIVYHGTKADFDTFKIGKDIVGSGMFFTPNQDYASNFPRKTTKEGSKVMSLYLKLENPISEYDFFSIGNNDGERTLECIKLGYDGLISDDNVFLVFHPNQIKSAIGNDGSWDINDNNIYS